MAIKLEATNTVEKKAQEVKKIKVKFNVSTALIKDKNEFASKLVGIEKDSFLFYPSPVSYKHFTANQIVELTAEEFALLEEQAGHRTVSVNNERMGNLSKIYKERLAGASPSEKIYIKENEHEFTACSFKKPIFEVIH